MTDNSPKTERMNIPANNKTERMEVPDTPSSDSSAFTGSLKSGEVIKGYEVKALISASTGEAEIFSAQKESLKAIIKYYHANFKPKEDILLKFHNIVHPDIITLYEYGTHKGRFYEIMEYAEGGTLDDKNPDGTFKYLPMPESDVKQIIDETINAFLHLHKEGVIHRDIKPGNLFYKNADGSDLLLGDFGISSELDTAGGMSKRMTSTLALSEGYAAPELYGIAKDDNKVKILIGPEVDYYALGITVFELLTGINPFAGRNPLHIMRDTIEGRVADDLLSRQEAQKISPHFQKLIRGLLTVRHDKRWKYSEVSRWLKGEVVPVFQEVQRQNVPALKFGDKTISSIDDLVEAVNADRELGKKYLMRGMFDQWAMKFDESLANDIMDIKEMDISDDEKTSTLIFKLNPDLPCRVDENAIIRDVAELVELIRVKPHLMGEVIFKNKYPDFYIWLSVNMPELGQQLKAAKIEYNRSGDLSEFNLIKNTNQIYISLAGEMIRPFPENNYEITSLRDIIEIPENLKERVLEELSPVEYNSVNSILSKNRRLQSILYLWLLKNNRSVESQLSEIKDGWIQQYLKRAYTKIKDNKFDDAISNLESALNLNENNPDVYTFWGYLKSKTGFNEEAVEYYTKSIRIKGTVSSYLGRGDAFRKLNRLIDALADYVQAVKIKPDDTKVLKKISETTEEILKNGSLVFGEKLIVSTAELSDAMSSDRIMAGKYLEFGLIEKWLSAVDPSLENFLKNIKKSDLSDDELLTTVIFKLDPSSPCRITEDINLSDVDVLIKYFSDKRTELFPWLLIYNKELAEEWFEKRLPSEKSNDYYNNLPKYYTQITNESNSIIEPVQYDLKTEYVARIIHEFYFRITGGVINSFIDENYSITEVQDLLHIPDELKNKLFEQMNDSGSILVTWFKIKGRGKIIDAWKDMDKTWENFEHILRDEIVYKNHKWMSINEKQRLDDEQRIEEERIREEEEQRRIEEERKREEAEKEERRIKEQQRIYFEDLSRKAKWKNTIIWLTLGPLLVGLIILVYAVLFQRMEDYFAFPILLVSGLYSFPFLKFLYIRNLREESLEFNNKNLFWLLMTPMIIYALALLMIGLFNGVWIAGIITFVMSMGMDSEPGNV